MTTQYNGEPYATEWLISDSIAYDVIAHTAKTITVRRRFSTDKHAPGSQFPIIMHETESCLTAPTKVLRLRKDGTYRMGSYAGAHSLHFTNTPPLDRRNWEF